MAAGSPALALAPSWLALGPVLSCVIGLRAYTLAAAATQVEPLPHTGQQAASRAALLVACAIGVAMRGGAHTTIMAGSPFGALVASVLPQLGEAVLL